MLRAGTTVLSVAMLGGAVWLLQSFYARTPQAGGASEAAATEPVIGMEGIASVPQQDFNTFYGIPRIAQPYTTIPTRPRQELVKYTVEDGDTVFGIAEKFGLKPETILWGNYGLLLDSPHSLKPGQELIILPVDGVYWQWVADNKGGLPAFAKYFGVQPEDILNLPANHLDPAVVGDTGRQTRLYLMERAIGRHACGPGFCTCTGTWCLRGNQRRRCGLRHIYMALKPAYSFRVRLLPWYQSFRH
jgi:LysM repeat protein